MSMYKRQIKIFDPSKHEAAHAVIVGCGNIGSHTALALARMGVQKFTLIDFDTVETHNISSQAYSFKDRTGKKTFMLERHIKEINGDAQVTRINKSFQNAGLTIDKSDQNYVLISAVDSMSTRYEMCDMLQYSNPDIMVIDGRLGGGQIEVHTQTAKEWRDTLTRDADTDPCGARYISYTSYIIAGLIANNLKRYLQGERYAKTILMHTNTLEIIKKMV